METNGKGLRPTTDLQRLTREGNPSKFQHALVVSGMDEKRIMNVAKKKRTEIRKISLLKMKGSGNDLKKK